MHHPLPNPHREGVIVRYLQIIHHLRPRGHFPTCDHPHAAICPQHMQSYMDLACWHKPLLGREEGMFTGGMHHFVRLRCRHATLSLCRRSDRQIDQVMVGMLPHVQDRLPLHFVRFRVVRQYLVTDMEFADVLFAMIGAHLRIRRKATGGPWSNWRTSCTWWFTAPSRRSLWLQTQGDGSCV